MALVVSLLTGVASASHKTSGTPGTTIWDGYGSVVTGGVRLPKTVKCDSAKTPYLVWVLSESKATTASILIPGQSSVSMGTPKVDKYGKATFTYTWSPGSAINMNTLYKTVTATYNDLRYKAKLAVKQGCVGTGGGTTTTTTPTSTSTTSTSTTSTSTTSTSTTSTTVPARLTVHLIGDHKYGNPSSQWLALGSVWGFNTALKVCETGLTTGCVDFATGATPGSTGTITLSGPNKALDVTTTDDLNNCSYSYLYSSDVAANDFYTTTPLEYGDTFTSTSTFSNGGDVWVAVECAG